MALSPQIERIVEETVEPIENKNKALNAHFRHIEVAGKWVSLLQMQQRLRINSLSLR